MKLNEQRKIYKLHSAQLRAAKWNLTLPLDVAKKDYPDTIISLNDSQVLRWVDEINGIEDANGQIAEIKQLIRIEKKKDTAVSVSDGFATIMGIFAVAVLCVLPVMVTNSYFNILETKYITYCVMSIIMMAAMRIYGLVKGKVAEYFKNFNLSIVSALI